MAMCRQRNCYTSNFSDDDEYNIACLLMVFVAVALPKLARSDMAFYKASFEGERPISCIYDLFVSNIAVVTILFVREKTYANIKVRIHNYSINSCTSSLVNMLKLFVLLCT